MELSIFPYDGQFILSLRNSAGKVYFSAGKEFIVGEYTQGIF